MSENPFELLRLDPSVSDDEIVRQAGRLRRLAANEAALNAVRQAVQELTGPPDVRTRHALLTHPRPVYLAPALERLAAAFRRPPEAAPAPCPPLDVGEFTDQLLAVVVSELAPTPLPLEPVAAGDDSAEVRRQMAEALWQALLANPGA
jgi:hypothetical protein